MRRLPLLLAFLAALAATTLGLHSCTQRSSETPLDPSFPVIETTAIEATVAAWRSFGLPVRCETRDLTIEYAPREVVDMCGPKMELMPGTRIGGCYISSGAGEATIILPSDQDVWATADALAHEVIHYLVDCAYGHPDAEHELRPEGVCLWDFDLGCVYGEALARI